MSIKEMIPKRWSSERIHRVSEATYQQGNILDLVMMTPGHANLTMSKTKRWG